MSHWEHSRFQIWSGLQHPLKHTLADFGYSNPGLAGVTTVEAALNYIVAVLYPTTKATVANVAALPAVGNTLNDYRVVLDDGDGKSAGYRWEQREGEVSPSWHKVFDFDWSTEGILAAYQDITQDLYVYQKGKSDLDAAGAVITGLYAGQKIYGGNLAGQNLTLAANAGDGTGAHTGFVQVDDNFRPTVHNTYNLGTPTEAFANAYIRGSIFNNALTITSDLITSSTGSISFDNENLSTTGAITGASHVAGSLTISDGSIVDTDGTISFGSTNLTTSGTITGASGSALADFTFTTGVISCGNGEIDFDAVDFTNIGTIDCTVVMTGSFTSGNIEITGNTISANNLNGSVQIIANGTGIVDIQSDMQTLGITSTGVVSVTGQLNVDNVRIDSNVISTTLANANLLLSPNGTGSVVTNANFIPGASNTLDLGTSALQFKDLFLVGNISDGTTNVSSATIQSLRDINVGVSAGMSLFYDGTKWVASVPDSEITHASLSGLTTGDAGHTQFALLAGRAGGQSLIGGTAASEELVFESTSNATKGSVKTKDNFVAFTNASFSGSWSGTDLGGSSNYFRDLYTKGEAKGLRIENYTSGTLPASSAANVGRVVYASDNKKIYVDTGTAFQVAGASKYSNDESFDGSQLTKNVTVSGSIQDARTAVWQLLDNANDFARIYCTIKATSASIVQVVTNTPLPAGSYRLVGVE
jgi:hypothetical protein